MNSRGLHVGTSVKIQDGMLYHASRTHIRGFPRNWGTLLRGGGGVPLRGFYSIWGIKWVPLFLEIPTSNDETVVYPGS